MPTPTRRCSRTRSSWEFGIGKSRASAASSFSGAFLGVEVEFVTVMWFDSLDAVRTFAGEDYEVAVVPPKAWALLAHFDGSQHYHARQRSTANPVASSHPPLHQITVWHGASPPAPCR